MTAATNSLLFRQGRTRLWSLPESQHANNPIHSLTAKLSGKEFPIPSPWRQFVKKSDLKIAFIWLMKNNK